MRPSRRSTNLIPEGFLLGQAARARLANGQYRDLERFWTRTQDKLELAAKSCRSALSILSPSTRMENQAIKIVVIGGTGFIGSKVVSNLRHKGHEVVAAAPKTSVDIFTGDGLKEAL